jgi:hypothetical protein
MSERCVYPRYRRSAELDQFSLSFHELYSICMHHRHVHTARRSLTVQSHSLRAFTPVRCADQRAIWKHRWSRPVSWFVSFCTSIYDSTTTPLCVLCGDLPWHQDSLTDACATVYVVLPTSTLSYAIQKLLASASLFSDSQNGID